MRIDEFMAVYEQKLTEATQLHPERYFWFEGNVTKLQGKVMPFPKYTIPQMVAKMREAVINKSFLKESETFVATCKHFGIKHTYKAIHEFIGV